MEIDKYLRSIIKVIKVNFSFFLYIQESLDRISMIFETIQDMQTRLRSRYSRHHYLQNSNLSLVQWFSGISCLLMVGVGGLQVFLIRNLFKENTHSGLKAGLWWWGLIKTYERWSWTILIVEIIGNCSTDDIPPPPTISVQS